MSVPAVKCSGRVFEHYHFRSCPNTGKIERDGKHYCRIHDPVRRKEKDDARKAKWDAEWEATKVRAAEQTAARARAELCVEACAWLTDEEVKQLARVSKNDVIALLYKQL